MRHIACLASLLAALLALAGCGPIRWLDSNSTSCMPLPRDPGVAPVDGLSVLPDDERAPVIDEIDRAACRIGLAIYLLSDDATIDALIRAKARGVEARVLYEPAPFGGGVGIVETTEDLAEHGIELRSRRDAFTFVHAKYLVVDRQVGIVTNQNLTYSAFESNRELGVVTTATADVATLAAIFEADWSGTAPPVPTGRMILSPGNALPALLEQIQSAESSIRLYAEVIRDDELIDALSAAAQQGISVEVLVNAPDDELDGVVYQTLTSNGVEVRITSHIYVHAKGLIIDDRSVVIGSHNPTDTSLEENREVSLVLDDPITVMRAIDVFEDDWERSANYSFQPASATP